MDVLLGHQMSEWEGEMSQSPFFYISEDQWKVCHVTNLFDAWPYDYCKLGPIFYSILARYDPFIHAKVIIRNHCSHRPVSPHQHVGNQQIK